MMHSVGQHERRSSTASVLLEDLFANGLPRLLSLKSCPSWSYLSGSSYDRTECRLERRGCMKRA